ncbi:MAG TPA: hypothetical protein EYH44_05075 [Thermoprotei archaeon]|nr:hypothetical protein [Thermoprotei archaeon]
MKIKIRRKSITNLIKYFRENWGAPFIIAFMGLLIGAAYYLSIGNDKYANTLAEYAYYNLVIGVALQFISYIKYGGDEE